MSELLDRKEASTKLIFHGEKHAQYISRISNDTDSFEYVVTQHLRMSGARILLIYALCCSNYFLGVYWGLAGMSILGRNLGTDMRVDEIVSWVLRCQDESGG